MTLALAIASFSFFLGQAKVIPRPIRIYPVLAIPPLIVLVVMVYRIWRIRFRRRRARVVVPAAWTRMSPRTSPSVAYTSET